MGRGSVHKNTFKLSDKSVDLTQMKQMKHLVLCLLCKYSTRGHEKSIYSHLSNRANSFFMPSSVVGEVSC